jgi:hypothetical protein
MSVGLANYFFAPWEQSVGRKKYAGINGVPQGRNININVSRMNKPDW